MPQPRTYLVPPRAIAYLAPYNRGAQQDQAKLAKQQAGAAPEFIKVKGLSLVHEGSDRIVLLSPDCNKLIRLPKEWFQVDVWDTPAPETAPAPQPPDCPEKDTTADSNTAAADANGKPLPDANPKASQPIAMKTQKE